MPGGSGLIDEANLSDFRIIPIPETGELYIAWASTQPEGQWFQVYKDKRLAWYGQARHCYLPATRGYYEVVEVDPADVRRDLSDQLTDPPGTGSRVQLSWHGGRYLIPTSHDLAGFNVYGEATPGGGISYAAPIAFIPARLGSEHVDGFGRGRFGRGSFGYSEVTYRWLSPRMTAGEWNFAVKAVDSAGTEATVATTSAIVDVPPTAPAPFATFERIQGSYELATNEITITWNPATP